MASKIDKTLSAGPNIDDLDNLLVGGRSIAPLLVVKIGVTLISANESLKDIG